MHIDTRFTVTSEGVYDAFYKTDLFPHWEKGCSLQKHPKGWRAVGLQGEVLPVIGRTRAKTLRAVLNQRWTAEAEAIETGVRRARQNNYSRGLNRRVSRDIASALYTLLVASCGATDLDHVRSCFVGHMSRDTTRMASEIRIGGTLGWGAKFWNDHNGFRVSMYTEDETPARRIIQARTNKALQALYTVLWPYAL